MKNLVLFIVVVLLSFNNISAQTESYTAIDSIRVFNKTIVVKNYDNETTNVGGKEFKIYETDNGKLLLLSKSHKGKTYPVWLGEYNENCNCRLSTSGKKITLYLKKNGYPHIKYE